MLEQQMDITRQSTFGYSTNKITLTTPFANKKYCFDKYYEAIKKLDYPKDKIFALWYDNSNDKDFGKMLKEKIKIFPRHRIIKDDTPYFTIENTSDYGKVSYRCHEVYKKIADEIPSEGYMFNVEDDVEVPPDSLKKMLAIFNKYPKVGTVIGSLCSRRTKDRVFKLPVVWKFRRTRTFPEPDTCNEITTECLQIQNLPSSGIEVVGSGHMGCWLAPAKLVKKIGFKWSEDGVMANDIVWGYRLKKAGYQFLIDWSIVCKHWWCVDGKIGYY